MKTEHINGLSVVIEITRDVARVMDVSFYEALIAGCDLPVEHQWELIELMSAQ